MVKVENVLWLTDFSPDSTHALAYARMLAELHNTKLILMHVIDNPTSSNYGRVPGDYLAMEAHAREKSRAWLQGYVRKELADFTNCETLVREGEILEKILEAEKAFHVGTIVIGTHGRSGLTHLLLGSMAEKIIRSVHCPVYVIRHPDRQSERMAA